MRPGTDPHQNHLLGALPPDILDRWQPALEAVPLSLGQVLYESGRTMSHAIFPTTAIVSLQHVLENGDTAETALVGHEGLVGVALFMGGGTTPSRAVVHSAGAGLRIPAELVRQEFERCMPVRHLLLRYTQALITQMAQTAVCNRLHSVDQRLCRWLLMGLDRLGRTEIAMTQELIASLLGVRREGVSEAAHRLQRAGVIRYSRGRISVLDRGALERRACECYAVVRREYARLLPHTPAT